MNTGSISSFLRPAEWSSHGMTIMAWPDFKNPSYGDEYRSVFNDATKEVSLLAEAIANFEPVQLLVTSGREVEATKRFGKQGTTYNVTVQVIEGDQLDFWTRDFPPTYTLLLSEQQNQHGCDQAQGSVLYGIDFNFNGWGGRYPARTTRRAAEEVLKNENIPRIDSSLNLEGGAIEVDGEGTMLATESSVINNNRNPGKTRADVERELEWLIGIRKFIWFPGVRNKDVTDSHVDGLARFVRPGVVLLSKPWAAVKGHKATKEDKVWIKQFEQAKEILNKATDAKGRNISVIEIEEGDYAQFEGISADDEAPSLTYVNYYVCNGGVIIPEFGIPETDKKAKEVIQELVGKGRKVVSVPIRTIPVLGGGIHCSTQEVPAVRGVSNDSL